jgi:CRP/FNR family cyclic AMP-dependent transcriptional regulator
MLRTLPLFSLIPEDQFAALLPSIQRRDYLARALILRAGERPDGLYVILAGKVKVLVDDGEGREFVVSVLGRNEFFGELGLIDGEPAHVTVESLQACEMVYVPRKRFVECLERSGGAAMLVLRTVLTRLRDAHGKIEALALMTVYGRVARVLLDLGHEENRYWRVELGTEQIAAMVGASREMVSRVLKDMIATGMVERDKRQLIVDRAAIAEQKAVIRARPRDPRNRDARVARLGHNGSTTPVTTVRGGTNDRR